MKSTVKSRLQDLLKSSGKSPFQLAKESGVEYTTIDRILSGDTQNPNINTLKPLADVFDVNPIWLKTGDGSKEPESVKTDVYRDALIARLEKEAETWRQKYEQVWTRLDSLMDRIPLGKFKPVSTTGLVLDLFPPTNENKKRKKTGT